MEATHHFTCSHQGCSFWASGAKLSSWSLHDVTAPPPFSLACVMRSLWESKEKNDEEKVSNPPDLCCMTESLSPQEWDVVSNEITPRPDLPTLSLDEARVLAAPPGRCTNTVSQVAKHYDMDTGVWVTYRGGVYDVTSFVKGEPEHWHAINTSELC